MELSNQNKIIGNKGSKKRIGRGGGSGKGFHTVGKGHKGQNARSGHGIPVGFEGGQVPLYKKLPRIRGKSFKRSYKVKYSPINLYSLRVFKDGDIVSPQTLLEKHLIEKTDIKKGIKILSHGDIDKKLNFNGIIFSKAAVQKIEAAGGKIVPSKNA
jgi:large subunit ribosomal protein L15